MQLVKPTILIPNSHLSRRGLVFDLPLIERTTSIYDLITGRKGTYTGLTSEFGYLNSPDLLGADDTRILDFSGTPVIQNSVSFVTVEMIVFPTGINAANDVRVIHKGGGNKYFSVGWGEIPAGSPFFQLFAAFSGGDLSTQSDAIVYSHWYHVFMTYVLGTLDGSKTFWYTGKDGGPLIKNTGSTFFATSGTQFGDTTDLGVWNRPTTAGTSVKGGPGKLALLRYWNRILAFDEMRELDRDPMLIYEPQPAASEIYYVNIPNITTTQTQLGKARIQETTNQTQLGKARIQETTTQTQTGKARIQETVNQTQLGKSRIQESVNQSQLGKTRITAITTQTQLGKARIQETTTQTITGKSRIQESVNQTQTGKARITATTTQTQLGKARIQETTTQTQSGKSRIQESVNQTQTGKSRITAKTTQTQQGKSRITAITTQTQAGKARIQESVNQTQTGKARIQETTSQQQTGKARVTAITLQNQQGKTRITALGIQVQLGKSRLQQSVIRTITGISRITQTTNQTITGKARIIAPSGLSAVTDYLRQQRSATFLGQKASFTALRRQSDRL